MAIRELYNKKNTLVGYSIRVGNVSATIWIPTLNFSFYCPDEKLKELITDKTNFPWLRNEIKADLDGAKMIETIINECRGSVGQW